MLRHVVCQSWCQAPSKKAQYQRRPSAARLSSSIMIEPELQALTMCCRSLSEEGTYLPECNKQLIDCGPHRQGETTQGDSKLGLESE